MKDFVRPANFSQTTVEPGKKTGKSAFLTLRMRVASSSAARWSSTLA
jgi:hypothetical protein